MNHKQLKENIKKYILELLQEKAVSPEQKRFMGAVYGCKKTGKCGSKEIRDAAKSMKKSSIKHYLQEDELEEAHPYLSLYGGKSDWFVEPIDFKKEYPDFQEFLSATGDKEVNADWVQAGSSGDFVRLLGKAGIPAQARHEIAQKANKFKKWWNSTFSTFKEWGFFQFFFIPFVQGRGQSPQKLYDRYVELLRMGERANKTDEKANNAEIQGLQFVLEYEYEKWKGEQQQNLSESFVLKITEEFFLEENETELFEQKLSQRNIEEAEYNGRKVTLNKPISTPEGPKKSKVYVKDGDKVKLVRFGDPNMRIKKSNPERRKSFRARHNCENPGPKTSAKYWSCKKW